MRHHTKSKKSLHAERTQMSAVDADCQPIRSRSQSYRDRLAPEPQASQAAKRSCEEHHLRVKARGQSEKSESAKASSNRSDSSLKK
mmetsp:Transcript_11923/g.16206  ORF Transcript_11923/g.16206 Transcript_11923/m.16206 type:complete len:86 (+) Transcript_11923:233-490(+)